MKTTISVNELMNVVSQETFEELGQKYKVDFKAKKLSGQQFFKLLLHGLLSEKTMSLRVLEELYSTPIVQNMIGSNSDRKIDHSSLASRLSIINVEYFKALFEHYSNQFASNYSSEEIKEHRIIRFDSTMVTLSSKLLKKGMRNGEEKRNGQNLHVKFSVGFDGTCVNGIEFFNEQNEISENVALPVVIKKIAFSERDIAVFDRGISKRKAFEAFSEQDIQFVTRIRASTGDEHLPLRYEKVREITKIPKNQPITTETLQIIEDIEVHLYSSNRKKTIQSFRLIRAIRLEDGKPINFLSNMTDLSVEDITEIYRKRWAIELFFKLIKQEFNFKHFLSRNENGIKVMMYVTAIAAMCIYIYRKLNTIGGFKIAKIRFTGELEREVIMIIIKQCEGNPEVFDRLYPKKE